MDVFISYAREDAAHANRLYDDLLALPNVTPWLDSKRILPGSRWRLQVMETLRTCDLFIVLLSERSVAKSGFVQREISEALEKLKSIPPDRIFVIPARLDDCHPGHPELRELQWVDLFPDWDSGFARIVAAIRGYSTQPFTPPVAPEEDMIIETIISAEAFARRLLARGEMRGCDAMELRFSAQQFQGLDLSGANFVRCHFSECDFSNANLRGANFEGATFRDCRVGDADLWGVNFWGATLSGITDLEDARLQQTNFFGAHVSARQGSFLADRDEVLSLGDYGSFVKHFSEERGMTEDALASTFIWLNHRYFRLMFRKNSDSVFRR
jgi:hypothetical protein